MPETPISAMGRHELEELARALLEQRARLAREEHIYSSVTRKLGVEHQMRLAQEECCELGAAINQFLRKRISVAVLASEVADVEIMCAQLRRMVGDGAVDKAKREKIERLARQVGGGRDE